MDGPFGRRAVGAGRQRGPAPRAPRPTRGWPRCDQPLERSRLVRGNGAVMVHRTRRSNLRWPPGWAANSRRPARSRSTRGRADRARNTVSRLRAGAAAADGQVPRLRLVQRAVPAAARPGSRRAEPAHATRVSKGCCPSSGRTSTGSGTPSDVEVEGDAELQQAVRFGHVPRAAGRRPKGGDPGQGPGRQPGRRAHASGTPRRTYCRCSTHTLPGPSPTRCTGAKSILDQARDRAGPRAGRGRLPVANDRRCGCFGYRPAGTATFHVNADIAGGGGAAPRRHRGRGPCRPSAGW